MTLEQLLLCAIVPYSLLSAGLIAGLYLFHTLKVEIAKLRGQCHHQVAALQCSVQRSETRHTELEQDFERVLRGIATPGMDNPGVGPFRRARIHGMQKRGEPISMIADTLGIPDAQVDLALKVQRLTTAVS